MLTLIPRALILRPSKRVRTIATLHLEPGPPPDCARLPLTSVAQAGLRSRPSAISIAPFSWEGEGDEELGKHLSRPYLCAGAPAAARSQG